MILLGKLKSQSNRMKVRQVRGNVIETSRNHQGHSTRPEVQRREVEDKGKELPPYIKIMYLKMGGTGVPAVAQRKQI